MALSMILMILGGREATAVMSHPNWSSGINEAKPFLRYADDKVIVFVLVKPKVVTAVNS